MSEPTKSTNPLHAAWTAVLERVSSLKPRTLAWGGLALAAVILLSVNLMSSLLLKGWNADLTQDRLFTISDGARSVLTAIGEPIKVRVYFSKSMGEIAPAYQRYFERIRTLLEKYRDISGGKLELEFLNPEPFTDAEDQAVAAGLKGMRLNAEGETAYFGLIATNSTDNGQTIAYLTPDRESFVEYDITKLLYMLSNPKKRVVGLMTSLPLEGGKSPMQEQQQSPPWLIMDQIRDFFDVQTIEQDVKEIPKNIDVLMVAQPNKLTPAAAYAIDQFALKGGKVLALVDPMAEAAFLEVEPGDGKAEIGKVLKAWGLDFDPKQAAADIQYARRVQFGRGGPGGNNLVTEYVGWLSLDHKALNDTDVLSNGVDILNLASTGFLTKADGAKTDITPILSTSTSAMVTDAKSFGMQSDPAALLRNYKPGGKSLMLAARVSGEVQSAFPDGPPKAGDAKKTDEEKKKTDEEKKDAAATGDANKEPHIASGRVNAIVVADTDLLADRFWVDSRDGGQGQRIATPVAHNAAFILGALENLSGNDALIALRSRGVKDRPFTLVENIRRDAEKEYREKEAALTEKLKNVEQELRKLEQAGQGGAVALTDAEQKSIERFRQEMLATRSELRKVKLALRRDIDSLDGWLKFANIALMPLLVAFAGIGWSIWQSRKRKSGS